MTYIHIVKYSSGTSVKEQINGLSVEGKITEDTRLFFSKNNLLTMKDLAEVAGYFDFVHDGEFDDENLVLKPRKYVLARSAEKKDCMW